MLGCAGALLLALGCGGADPHGRQPVSGTVSFKGRPLDQGRIQFLPMEVGKGAGAGSLVAKGNYAIPASQGLSPGQYRVQITSPKAKKGAPLAGPPGMKMPPPGEERIPAEYNLKSRLTVDVKQGAENKFDFTID